MKTQVIKSILFALLFTAGWIGTSAQQPAKMLSRDEAIADIDSLLYTLTEVHPNLFANCGQGELFATIDKTISEMPDSMTSAELYKYVAPFVARIGDGHTSLWFPYNDYFTQDTQRLPLYMKATKDKRLLVESCLDDKIPYGAEVLEINGISSQEMVDQMLRYASGEKEFYRIERVNNEAKALMEILFKADKYSVVYRKEGSKKAHTIDLPTANVDVLRARMPRREKPQFTEPYSLSIDKAKKVAVMNFRTYSDSKKMSHFADSMFTVMRDNGIKKLIIDIRENGGGSTRVGDVLLRYLSPRPFAQMGKIMVRVSPTTIQLFNNGRPPLGWYYHETPESDLIQPLTAEQGHFDGEVILLTSHHTFSSASSFAWAFKQFGMGTIIGEETGGMNVSFGDVLMYRLPHSGLQCSISYKRFWHYGADENDIHGTLPDIDVPAATALEVALK